jgi:NAD(P)H-nitrite reductase large subunit
MYKEREMAEFNPNDIGTVGDVVNTVMIKTLTNTMEQVAKAIQEHNDQLKAVWLAIDRLEKVASRQKGWA